MYFGVLHGTAQLVWECEPKQLYDSVNFFCYVRHLQAFFFEEVVVVVVVVVVVAWRVWDNGCARCYEHGLVFVFFPILPRQGLRGCRTPFRGNRLVVGVVASIHSKVRWDCGTMRNASIAL